VKNHENYKEVVEQITRVINITQDKAVSGSIKEDLFETSSEQDLAEAVKDLEETFEETDDAAEHFKALEKISSTISEFFEHNMIMVDDEAIKENRLSLLNKIAVIAHEFADFRKLVI
jgi:glycyl-tRNA synthetase beta chain